MTDLTPRLDPKVLKEYLEASVRNADNVLGTFIERLHQDPVEAFRVADLPAQAAAGKCVAEVALRMLEEGVDVRKVTTYATTRVFEKALESPRNVSPYQNLMEDCVAARWAELLKFLLEHCE